MEPPAPGGPGIQDRKIWLENEPLLREFYMDHQLTVAEVKVKMESDHNWPVFTLAKYRSMFKEFKLVRNWPSHYWKAIGFRIDQRRQQGKESEVVMLGRVVEPVKINRQISRHRFTTVEKATGLPETMADGLDGVVIRTPPPGSPRAPVQGSMRTSSMVKQSSNATNDISSAQLNPVMGLNNKNNEDLSNLEHPDFSTQSIENRARALTIDHLTDSGYGSLDIGKHNKSGRVNEEAPSASILTTIDESEDQGETQTVYSDTESLNDPVILEYIAVFADELVRSLPSGFDAAEFGRVSEGLDELLQAFSVIIGSDGNTPEHRKLMYLVYRFRKNIIAKLEQLYAEPPPRHFEDPKSMSVEEKMSVLWGERDDNIAPVDLDFLSDDDSDENDEESLPDLETYRGIIYQTSAFQWLGSRVSAADRLNCPGPFNTQTHIRGLILKSMVPHKRFSRATIPKAELEYRLDWNLSAFHIEQQYSCSVEDVLKQSITITGFGNDIQAATCFAYIEQTWGDAGKSLLYILQRAVKNSLPVDQEYGHARLNATTTAEATIDVSYTRGSFVVTASGLPYHVAEIGEILAWITAALRQSPDRTTVTACRPVVSSILPRTSGGLNPDEGTDAITTAVCNIGVTFRALDPCELEPDSRCWLGIVRNPVIVDGYPIPRRSLNSSGLEVSIEIMISLANARYIVDFNRRTFFKGFSTMLVVTQVSKSIVFWHLCYNADRSYISYEDSRAPRVSENSSSLALDHGRILGSRHILGWCRNVDCLAGTPRASYEIGWSKLKRPNIAFAVDKASITAGKYVNIGTSLSIGLKDKPEHIDFGDDYISNLNMIHERHFVFYDVAVKRAWRQLVGFDFMDIAIQSGSLSSRGHLIDARGEGWVDFARELDSVALFGRNFGDLMKPKGIPCWQCMSNTPPGPDLLGVTVQDIHRIMEKRGDRDGNTWRVVENIHWFVPDKLHEPCQCHTSTLQRRDRVQVFLPAGHPKLYCINPRSPHLEDGGAILVGHSFAYPLRWGRLSLPEEGEPGISDNYDRSYLPDRGMGASGSWSNTENLRSTGSKRPRLYYETQSEQDEVQSSSSGMYMHENAQFLHQSSSSGTNADTSNTEMLASTGSSITAPDSNIGHSLYDKGKGKETESVRTPTVDPRFRPVGTAGLVRPSSSRPSGNFTSQWLSYNNTERRDK
ncbi:Pfs domain protein [Apiospora saccharicola]